MKLEITKTCADSLRAFTQNNYGIQLKSSHAHELVSAYFGYKSRAALIADKQCPISNLPDAEIIILNPATSLVDQRLLSLENLPSELPSSNILAKGVYAPIIADEQFSGRVWTGFQDLALTLVEERAKEFRMFGKNIREMDWISHVDLQTIQSGVRMSVIFDYPTNTNNPQRYSKVEIELSRVAGGIGYTKLEVKPTFYYGHMADPNFRLKHGID
ncbi:hypothetical protein [Mucilaginibacter lacusdianchii]|uniref:hypothetical protein n=1 Tax=Mucilaginibacter lacusdianchii TaxID=2684211 RepID=UPI00131BE215|nr:hypothetical protein [Mucilaginibacter sp. JXJ CY 39]